MPRKKDTDKFMEELINQWMYILASSFHRAFLRAMSGEALKNMRKEEKKRIRERMKEIIPK